jgi:hypothetical protein
MAVPDAPRVHTHSSSQPAGVSSSGFRTFDGYPYLVTRVVPTFYHLILLPADVSPDTLRDLARSQVRANHLPTCLVLGEDLCLYLAPEGGETVSEGIPRGGILVTDRLLLSTPIPRSTELAERCHWLQAFLETGPRTGALFEDLTKGGRLATPDEQVRLAGRSPSGVPNGLERCRRCGEWRGECLDPSEQFLGRLMRVHCRCENWNRCARCGERLYARRLNANYLNPDDGHIWHVPGFCALDHACNPK